MTPAEMARVLAKAAAYDARTIGEADVMAWLEAAGDVDFSDALSAVARHYTESTERIMPAHLRDQARRSRLAAIDAAPKCGTCCQSTLSAYHLRACPGTLAIDATTPPSRETT